MSRMDGIWSGRPVCRRLQDAKEAIADEARRRESAMSKMDGIWSGRPVCRRSQDAKEAIANEARRRESAMLKFQIHPSHPGAQTLSSNHIYSRMN
jgi:hypothetical protein